MNKIIYSDKTVTFPNGFKAAAVNSGLMTGRDDMALIYSEVPAECAIVFTTNKVKAAPVIWDQEITQDKSKKRAIVANVGSANACTGELGYDNARETSELIAALLDLPPEEILVASTGVIGLQLDMSKIYRGVKQLVPKLSESEKAGEKAAHAILTTDTKIKTASAEFMIGNKTVKIGAIAKGSGMIRPNMATMLSFVTTDVAIDQDVLEEALIRITKDTYNMISVDGDMSTNDTAVVLANGLADNEKITTLDSKEGWLFYQALFNVEKTLAHAIVKDGEGATKFIEVNVNNAKTDEDARILARAVAESNLVKAAFFGEDANWGRIISALGSSGAEFDQYLCSLKVKSPAGEMLLFENGKPAPLDEKKAAEILKESDIVLDIDIGMGDSAVSAWGCDLSYDYVKINGSYRT